MFAALGSFTNYAFYAVVLYTIVYFFVPFGIGPLWAWTILLAFVAAVIALAIVTGLFKGLWALISLF